jgi:hypothetical protein
MMLRERGGEIYVSAAQAGYQESEEVEEVGKEHRARKGGEMYVSAAQAGYQENKEIGYQEERSPDIYFLRLGIEAVS